MRYWWVNQNQTFAQESEGGYLWSPKRKSNDQRNPFYEFMREVAPGDVIFSFANTLISAISVAQSTAYEAPKPPEFGAVGPNWSDIGWKVVVRYFCLGNKMRPADHMERLAKLMPKTYAPLQTSGRGNQGVYLTSLPDDLADELVALIGQEAREIIHANRVSDQDDPAMADSPVDVIEWEDHLTEKLSSDQTLSSTEREAVILARRGQGIFKRNVQMIETKCRITGVSRPEHLIASHCKPWRDCDSNKERLDGENGLLLTPNIDHLFDRGLISFEGNGDLLIAPVSHRDSLSRMGVPVNGVTRVGVFSEGQRAYLDYHRERVFLQANR